VNEIQAEYASSTNVKRVHTAIEFVCTASN
jgi:hypothetical protein